MTHMGLMLTNVVSGEGSVTLLYDTSTSQPHSVVHANLRSGIFNTIHGLPHPDTNAAL